ncbi:hypothetical protein LOK49_Contig80G00012 [Camellia lanceoleosa]|nr:hypothetical protein LOK49_Contig80G00012 [Camellia lanceoleosa]
MAMAMRAAAAAGPGGLSLRGLLFSTLTSTSPFIPPPTNQDPPPSSSSLAQGLQDAFSKFGDVVHARVLTDHVSGYSNGFGFVRYATVEDAAEGIKGMDGKFLGGWVIFAECARPRPQPSQFKNNAGSQPPGHGSPYGRQ